MSSERRRFPPEFGPAAAEGRTGRRAEEELPRGAGPAREHAETPAPRRGSRCAGGRARGAA